VSRRLQAVRRRLAFFDEYRAPYRAAVRRAGVWRAAPATWAFLALTLLVSLLWHIPGAHHAVLGCCAYRATDLAHWQRAARLAASAFLVLRPVEVAWSVAACWLLLAPLEAAVGTASILLVNVCLRPVVRRLQARAKTAVEVETVYRMRAVCQTQEAGLVRNVFMRHINSHPSMNVQGLAMQDTEQAGVCAVVAEIVSHERNDKYLNEMVQRLGIEPCVTAVSWERVR